jgi:hypothetical protein
MAPTAGSTKKFAQINKSNSLDHTTRSFIIFQGKSRNLSRQDLIILLTPNVAFAGNKKIAHTCTAVLRIRICSDLKLLAGSGSEQLRNRHEFEVKLL